MKLLQILLLPFSFCYGFIMLVRNFLFDTGIIHSETFDIPVISIGNLSFGGTGKTPHIEYLIRLLEKDHSVATLSRGYGRSGSGFILASPSSDVKYIGDEPLQLVKKFPGIKVAVDEKRVRGIHFLIDKVPGLEVVLLDDAFQHRYVKPGLSILLTDYHGFYPDDNVFPSGRLREFSSGAARADVIIVTKTPKVFSPITLRRLHDQIKPKPHQKLYSSYIAYGNLVPFNEEHREYILKKLSYILLFTGIANDSPLHEELRRKCSEFCVMKFSDHHQYNMKDLHAIKSRFLDLPSRNKILVTTEKDMMRLNDPEFSNFLKDLPLFYLPIEINFHQKDKLDFDKLIIDYVGRNEGNS
jgi:tetraacyldisaccharide 4'-kinase